MKKLKKNVFRRHLPQVANLVCSPDSFFSAEDNWFGFIGLSKDKKEVGVSGTC